MYPELRPATSDEAAHHVKLLTNLVGGTEVVEIAKRLGLKRALNHSWESLSELQTSNNPDAFVDNWKRYSALVLACWVPLLQKNIENEGNKRKSVVVGWEPRGTTGTDDFVVERKVPGQESRLTASQDFYSTNLSASFRRDVVIQTPLGGERLNIKSQEFKIMFGSGGRINHLIYEKYGQVVHPSDPEGQELYLKSTHELSLLGLIFPESSPSSRS